MSFEGIFNNKHFKNQPNFRQIEHLNFHKKLLTIHPPNGQETNKHVK